MKGIQKVFGLQMWKDSLDLNYDSTISSNENVTTNDKVDSKELPRMIRPIPSIESVEQRIGDTVRTDTEKPGRIPQYSKNQDLTNVIKANKYLTRQGHRFHLLLRSGNVKAATAVFTYLIKDSKSFRVYYFNKVCKGGYYNFNFKRILGMHTLLDRTIKYWDANLISKRIYIPKSDNRLRPLGIPALHFRIITSMGAYYFRCVFEQILDNAQYGFRPNRSGAHAFKDLYKNSIRYQHAYEFDLKACFNRIELKAVERTLQRAGVPDYLINYVNGINTMPPISKEGFNTMDQEIVMSDMNNIYSGEAVPRLTKRGLPQGLPGSPILSIAVINDCLIKKHPKVKFTMYADDGIMFADDPALIRKVLGDPEVYYSGIVFSNKLKKNGKPASAFLETDVINFLGAKIDCKTGFISSVRGVCSVFDSPDRISKIIGNEYEKSVNNSGKWEVKPSSYMLKYLLSYDLGDWIYSIYGYLKDGFRFIMGWKLSRSFRGYGILTPYEVGKMSSHSCNLLLEDVGKILRHGTPDRMSKPINIFQLYRYKVRGVTADLFNSLRTIELQDPKDLFRVKLYKSPAPSTGFGNGQGFDLELKGYKISVAAISYLKPFYRDHKIFYNPVLENLDLTTETQLMRMGIKRERLIRRHYNKWDLCTLG